MEISLPWANRLIGQHDHYVKVWHDSEIEFSEEGILQEAVKNHEFNFRLWHIEDEARRRDVSDAYIAEQKRKIDGLNQARNDQIEKIDEWLIQSWPWITGLEDVPMNSETPGSIVDRLSIASLKFFHMNEELVRQGADPEHIRRCESKIEVMIAQRRDLACALDELLTDLRDRKKCMRVYRQFKMYNDPSLNPSLYQNRR